MTARYAFYRITQLTCPAKEFAPDALSIDAFLGGALQIAQPRSGYRAGVDPVLLAASVTAQAGQRILELGCGGGVASLCLGRRVDGLSLTGVELQRAYAELAKQNAARNSIKMRIVQADLTALPSEIKEEQFDHVLANPPYFDRSRSTAARDAGREIGLGEGIALEQWVKIAAKRLAPKGQAHFVQRIERLPDLLGAAQRYLGSIEVQPLSARAGRPAHLFLMRAKKAGRADFRLHAPIVVHDGSEHQENSKDYNALIEAALRHGAPLHFNSGA